jgi:tetratricopeptide (TPR) repeat protein
MHKLTDRLMLAVVLAIGALGLSRCASDELASTNRLVQQQQGEIEQMSQEIETLKANQRPSYNPGVATNIGGCDKAVESAATQRGGEKFAAGEFGRALAYYQDAVAACPTDGKGELNVARAYEAMGDKINAIKQYRKAADETGPVVTDAQDQARAALVRLQADRLP